MVVFGGDSVTPMSNPISHATYDINEKSLENMALSLEGLPDEISGFSLLRESVLNKPQ